MSPYIQAKTFTMAGGSPLPPLVGPTAAVEEEAEGGHSTHSSIETLVVVLAVITLVGVVAGIIARLCGGRRFGGHDDHDVEGWVERKCRSCIESGISTAPPPPPPPPPPAKEETPKPAAAEEAKK